MQVKRRINRFFGIILRREKSDHSEDEKDQSSSPKGKKKWNNQSYSQWDLMEHIADDSIQDEGCRQGQDENKIIYSDGLALDSLQSNSEPDNDVQIVESSLKRKSFLRRSGSFLRRSMSRKSKKEKADHNNQSTSSPFCGNDHDEDLTLIVKEINETLIEVATFGEETLGHHSCTPSPTTSHNADTLPDTCDQNLPAETVYNNWLIEEEKNYELQAKLSKKVGLTTGLKRQASKLASKFQRNKNGSLRLKPGTSMDSFPTAKLTRRNRSASFSASNVHIEKNYEDCGISRVSSLRRRISFKKARKVVKKGVSSFGKSMIHASSVMPVPCYEYPPASFYPEYNNYEEDDYPSELQRYYYRTQCYLPKDQHHKPASFYQHGYCYNG